MDVSYEWTDFVDLKFILAPLLIHVALAATLRRWLFPHVADRCVWLSTYIVTACLEWYLFGWSIDVDNIVAALPTLSWRIVLFVKIQWYLLIYFFLTSKFAARRSKSGWVVLRKFVPSSLLMLCYLYKWTPPSLTIRVVYIIIQFTVVDIGVDLYYMIKALKDQADASEMEEENLNYIVGWILNIMYPVLVVAWGIIIKQTYDLTTQYNIIWGYGVIALQVAVQICVLLPIRFKK